MGKSGEDDGREIALALLGNEPGAWERFHAAYWPVLLRAVYRAWRSDEVLRSRYVPEDLLHAFFSERLRPPEQHERMFRDAADGRWPFGFFLARCANNYCRSVARAHRSRGENATQSLPVDDAIDATRGEDEPEFSGASAMALTEQRVAQQLDCLRQTLVDAQRALPPNLHLLLLLHRLHVLELVGQAHLLGDGTLPPGVDPVELTEGLVDWKPAEESQGVCLAPGDGRADLRAAWERLAAGARPPPFHVEDGDVARVLGMPPTTLAVRKFRAQRRVEERWGLAECRDLFWYWY